MALLLSAGLREAPYIRPCCCCRCRWRLRQWEGLEELFGVGEHRLRGSVLVFDGAVGGRELSDLHLLLEEGCLIAMCYMAGAKGQTRAHLLTFGLEMRGGC